MNFRWTEPTARLLGGPWGKASLVLVAWTASISISIYWFLGLEAPCARLLGLWAANAGLLAILARRPAWLRLSLVYVMTALLAVAGFEAWMLRAWEASNGAQSVPSYPLGYFGSPWPDILGYGPPAGASGVSVYRNKDREIYRAEYHYDSFAHRRCPPVLDPTPKGRVLFFGCSFTLGEGVQDTETAAWHTAAMAQPLPVQNWGFHGYGPHQMLSALEQGLVAKAVPRDAPVLAVYQAVGDHVRRSAGLALYDNHGPRFRLGPTGTAELAGHFDDDRLLYWARKSMILRRITNTRLQTNAEDVSLWGAIVDKARHDIEDWAPGSRFYVVLWDSPRTKDHPAMEEELRRRGIAWAAASELIPEMSTHATEMFIPDDVHPSALAHQRLAEGLMRKWVAPWKDSLSGVSR